MAAVDYGCGHIYVDTCVTYSHLVTCKVDLVGDLMAGIVWI